MKATAAKVARRQALYDEILRSHPSLMRGRVWCGRCGQTRQVDAARCLREGWPKCCGATMSIDEPKEGKP